jgi:xyloglucan-specific endo-beta-1,4-glucanase
MWAVSRVDGSGGTSLSAVYKYHAIAALTPTSYQGTNLVANVACDLFLSSTANGDSEYEIMIWLAALGGAGPISATGSPIASVDIAGVSWKLYSGMNGAMHVYSFVAEGRTESFQGDLREFFGYLESNQGLGTGLYLTDVQAGTEPFTGQDARFEVSAYEVRVE